MSKAVDSYKRGRTPKPPRPALTMDNLQRAGDWRARLNVLAGDISLRDLADKSGGRISYTTVRSLLMDETRDAKLGTIAAFCDALGADMVFVMTGDHVARIALPDGAVLVSPPELSVVPIVPMAQAHNWAALAKVDTADALFLAGVKRGVRAARVTDTSMAPNFEKGDVITFRDGTPESGDAALVEVSGTTSLRIWRPRDGKVKLEATNTDFGSTTLSLSAVTVVGIVEGLHRSL